MLYEYDAFSRRISKEIERLDGSTDRTRVTWDGDVLLLEERFHVQPEQRRGGYDPIEDKPVTIAREDAEDK
ncbi:hypothetical protein GQ57_11200 [Burkholderia sp. MSh2]|uniref:Uncharacterized protein n=1 Tax=Burkholderia paludis TaxID=1506587 RepID=A0A6P2P4F2_9BURK|nr:MULTISPECIES: hypothetical protein [Burkholderia]KEZ05709.1 hypothetical protein GQ57_11200 [Burkholderia sp. MSh2]CAB3762423.1 hypothetical protein LMG30113_04189 [Burkholderia paludis]VWC02705.1 hypothetical protein BPA30113_04820 [Burkholderia paludis]